jgi:hypothetical protein
MYADLPVVAYGIRNEAADPPIPNPSRLIASRPAGTAAQLCGLAGYETPLTRARLRALYDGEADYRGEVAARLGALLSEGWFLDVYRDLVLDDAAGVTIP